MSMRGTTKKAQALRRRESFHAARRPWKIGDGSSAARPRAGQFPARPAETPTPASYRSFVASREGNLEHRAAGKSTLHATGTKALMQRPGPAYATIRKPGPVLRMMHVGQAPFLASCTGLQCAVILLEKRNAELCASAEARLWPGTKSPMPRSVRPTLD
jgi:hypothetical protein